MSNIAVVACFITHRHVDYPGSTSTAMKNLLPLY